MLRIKEKKGNLRQKGKKKGVIIPPRGKVSCWGAPYHYSWGKKGDLCMETKKKSIKDIGVFSSNFFLWERNDLYAEETHHSSVVFREGGESL